MTCRNILIVSLFAGLTPASQACASDDEHIRQIVKSMLREKDQKIEQLEARIRQLEDEKKQERGTLASGPAPPAYC